jgi:multidrug efflux system membrane fusion protein
VIAPQSAAPRPKTAAGPLVIPEDHEVKHHSATPLILIAVLVLAIGAIVGLVLFKSRQKPPPRAQPLITVSVTNAAKGNIDVVVWAIGTVTPVYTAMVSPRVDGQVVKVNYTEGQLVTTNDTLVQIDPRPYQAQLMQAEGQLARDQAQLEGAKVDLERFQNAYAKSIGTNVLHAVPKQQVDDQLATVHQYEGAVKVDEGQVDNMKVQLDYCSIHAPFDGRVGLRLVDPGNVVHASTTNALVVVTQLKPITVVFAVDQKHLPEIQAQLKAGRKMKVEVYNSDQTQKLATGEFLTMDNLIDVTTGTVRIKALFDNEDMALFPNQFVNAKLIINTLTNVTLIPTPAVQRNPQEAFVYSLEGSNQVKMIKVTPGVSEADVTAVEGLKPGQVVITDNYNKLGDGMKVNVRQPGGGGRGGSGQGHKKSDGGPPSDGDRQHAGEKSGEKSQDDGQ